MTPIIIFGLSFLITLTILAAKAFESNSQNPSFLLKLFKKLDPHAEKFIEGFKFRVLQVIQTARYIALVHAPEVLRELSHEIKESAMREYRVSQDIIMGRKNIVNKGAVSFYLKRIKEEKGTMRGQIQDSL